MNDQRLVKKRRAEFVSDLRNGCQMCSENRKCQNGQHLEAVYCANKDLIDRLTANQSHVSDPQRDCGKWIQVTKKLPKEGQHVLVIGKDRTIRIMRSGVSNDPISSSEWLRRFKTLYRYWTPIPKLPNLWEDE